MRLGHGTSSAWAGASQSQLLTDVAAWLVVNSMRTERVQFDQLCGQNLANIWRQNAWNLLLAEHQRFKVRPEATQGFALELLGEAFLSVSKGQVSKEKLEGKVVGLYFDYCGETGGDNELLSAMRFVYTKLGCEDFGGDVEFIYVTSADTKEEFDRNFSQMPWLTLPFTHAQRRQKLRELFGLQNGTGFVLIAPDGSTITREGVALMQIANAAERVNVERKSAEKSMASFHEMSKQLKKQLTERTTNLKPLEVKVRHLAKALAGPQMDGNGTRRCISLATIGAAI